MPNHLTAFGFVSRQTSILALIRHSPAFGIATPMPHDLRRTFAKLAHKGHTALEQIQISLGHSSIQTTERYIGLEQDLTDAPCDHLESG